MKIYKIALERPGGAIVDRSLEQVSYAIRVLQQEIHGVRDPEVKQSLNSIIARPLNDLAIKINELV